MYRIIYTTVIFMTFFNLSLFGSVFKVSDYSDLPDEDLDDGIYYPYTLRSAIQNANLQGTDAKNRNSTRLPNY